MSPEHAALTAHPAPHRERVRLLESAFALLGGPAAWIVQLCAGYGFASTPCFHHGVRENAVLQDLGWTSTAMNVVTAVSALVAIGALLMSWTLLKRTRDEMEGDHLDLMEIGAGRTRFFALWGLCLSAGFAVAIFVSALLYAVVPRCAG